MKQHISLTHARILLYVLCFAQLCGLTACSSEETLGLPLQEEGKITFSFHSDNVTRAANSYCNNRKPSFFKVWAFKGTDEYFSEGEPNYSGDIVKYTIYDNGVGHWDPVTTRFWPKGSNGFEDLTFYAYIDDLDMDNINSKTAGTFKYSLQTNESGNTEVVPMFENYTVEDDVDKQRDLMYAVKTAKFEKNGNKGTVKLGFRHALSQICFRARNDNHTLKDVVIKSIKVCGLTNHGDYTLPSSDTEINNDPQHPSTPTSGSGKGSWALSSDAADYNNTYSLSDLDIHLGKANPKDGANDEYEGTLVDISIIKNSNHQYDDDDAFKEDFSRVMTLIPQEVDAATANSLTSYSPDGAYFELMLDITTYLNREASEAALLAGNDDSEFIKREGGVKIQIPVDINWEEGYRYNYTLVWDDTQTILYKVDVADYIEAIPGDQNENGEIHGNFVGSHEKVLMRDAYTDVNGKQYDKLYVATCNLGATTPEDTGLFFWWGDTEGHYCRKDNNGKSIMYRNDGVTIDTSFSFDNVAPANQTSTNDLSKLVSDGYLSSTTDLELKKEKDAAAVMLGNEWRMPTKEDIDWLKANCEWQKNDGDMTTNGGIITFTTKGGVEQVKKIAGVKGYFVKSKRTFAIFFIPSGYVTSKILSNEDYSYSWSSSVDPTRAPQYKYSYMLFEGHADSGYERYLGLPIRPVTNKE